MHYISGNVQCDNIDITYFFPMSNDAASPRLEDVRRSLPLDLNNEPGALFRSGEAGKFEERT